MLPLDNLHVRDMADAGFIKQKKAFALCNAEQRWGYWDFYLPLIHPLTVLAYRSCAYLNCLYFRENMCGCLKLKLSFHSFGKTKPNLLRFKSIMPTICYSMDYHLSLVMRKPAFCKCENKDADQLRGNRKADQRLCFRYTDSTIPLLPIYEISGL